MIEATEDLSTAQLLQRVTEQTTTLVREEIRLAQLELTGKAKRAGIGIGAIVLAGLLAINAGWVLLAAAVLGLSTVLPGWLAALVVAAALLLMAVVLGLVAKHQIGKAVPPAPVEMIASTRDDVAAIKQAAGR